MIYFSAQLAKNPTYKPAAERLFSALRKAQTDFRLLDGTRDIWLRDFMPVKPERGHTCLFATHLLIWPTRRNFEPITEAISLRLFRFP